MTVKLGITVNCSYLYMKINNIVIKRIWEVPSNEKYHNPKVHFFKFNDIKVF